MINVACETKLRSVVRSSLHPCPENLGQSGLRSCILSGLPTYLVQELHTGTVQFEFSGVNFVSTDQQYIIQRRMIYDTNDVSISYRNHLINDILFTGDQPTCFRLFEYAKGCCRLSRNYVSPHSFRNYPIKTTQSFTIK